MFNDIAPAYFEFKGSGGNQLFVFQLLDTAKIQKARDILSGREKQFVHPQGTVIQMPAWYNPNWKFHLDPNSISFFEMAIEVCDANMQYIANHLDEIGGSFLPRAHWCPWNSLLTRELSL